MERRKILISGIVQGVGFRPFVRKQADFFGLSGFIRNTSDGVEILAEGEKEKLDRFVKSLQTKHPPLAEIISLQQERIERPEDMLPYILTESLPVAMKTGQNLKEERPSNFDKDGSRFHILPSASATQRTALISPDLCICKECLRELFDPKDRRFQYPFLNCTNCGPRFTIIKDIPYDRANTSMSDFPMCPECADEYEDVDNRRYHAQPDCCPECGPEVMLTLPFQNDPLNESNTLCGYDPSVFLTSEIPKDDVDINQQQNFFAQTTSGKEAIEKAARMLCAGKILAIKGLGGFHLACLADDEALVCKLRKGKQRDEKPFAVMVKNVETARSICRVSPAEEHALTGKERPIVLLEKKVPGTWMQISENNYIGIMLPYTPLHYLLFACLEQEWTRQNNEPATGTAWAKKDELHEVQIRRNEKDKPVVLVMTSANLSDRPILYKNEEALTALNGIADGFLLHNREIITRCDDSLLWVVAENPYFVRRSRGFVPRPIFLPKNVGGKNVLACGAEQKASFALAKGNQVFPSQHIGDLKNIETLQFYESQIQHFERIFGILPNVIACDLHPDYLSSRYAKARADKDGLPLVFVQHHHAHMAACMADNSLEEPCIGIIWDGTGLGTDGTTWGGEFLVGDYSGFERAGTLLPFRLPGGDKVTKELWRTALSLLFAVEESDGTLDSGTECIFDTRKDVYEAEGANPLPGDQVNGALNPVPNDGMTDVEKLISDGLVLDVAKRLYGQEKTDLIFAMLQADLNCPVCTSMGRLFDAVASLLGIQQEASYEGQGAVLLEAEAYRSDHFPGAGMPRVTRNYQTKESRVTSEEIFDYNIIKCGLYYFDYRPMLLRLVEKLSSGELAISHRRNLALMFMNTIMDMAVSITTRISADYGIKNVVLSGGTFQNQFLLQNLTERLREDGFAVYHHSRIATNDEGISVGQAMVAASRM